jgi:hypothetical protein
MKTQITLSKEQVEIIVTAYLTTKFKTMVIKEVKLEVGNELRGHQLDEHYEPVFKGAVCEVEV